MIVELRRNQSWIIDQARLSVKRVIFEQQPYKIDIKDFSFKNLDFCSSGFHRGFSAGSNYVVVSVRCVHQNSAGVNSINQ